MMSEVSYNNCLHVTTRDDEPSDKLCLAHTLIAVSTSVGEIYEHTTGGS